MSRKTTKAILSRDEISLLINSDEPQNIELYGNLYSTLCNLQNIKAITMDQLVDIDSKAKAALTYNKKTLIDTVIKEWYAESVSEEDSTNKVRCGLCNTPNKYLYYIRNRKNNILLNVGSSCIKKFPGIDGYIEQKKQLSQIHKNRQVIDRRNEFYQKFPDCETFIDNANNYFNTLPILIPYEPYKKLQDTCNRLRSIYDSYVNDGKKPFESTYNSFELFQLAKEQYNKLETQSNTFILSHSNLPLICKRREIDWILKNKKYYLLKRISENNGIYQLDTLREMFSYDFVKDNLSLFVKRNRSNILKFNQLSNNNFIISYNKFGYQPALTFTVSLCDFMKNIGANCLVDENYYFKTKELYQISKISNRKNNLFSILGYIDDILYELNYSFLFDEESNSLYLYRKADRSIRLFSVCEFMQNYSKYILLSDDEIKKYLLKIIGKHKKWATYEMQEKQGISDKISLLYKEYKESHDYHTHSVRKKGLELMVYDMFSEPLSDSTIIDFNSPEYMVLHREQLNVSNNQLKSIDYGIRILSDDILPYYSKNDLILVQHTQFIQNDSMIFFYHNNKIEMKKCIVPLNDTKNIFDFTNIQKQETIAYGKVVCCIRNDEI